MSQSRSLSFVEVITNIVVGGGIAFVINSWLFNAPLSTNLFAFILLTLFSFIRSYTLRRIFNAIRAPGRDIRPPFPHSLITKEAIEQFKKNETEAAPTLCRQCKEPVFTYLICNRMDCPKKLV